MHERTLVKSLIEMVHHESHVRRLGLIREVQVEIGEFSGVDHRLFEMAFDEMANNDWPGVKLRVELVRLTAMCQDCDDVFEVEQFQFICPECGSTDAHVRKGDTIRLTNLIADRTIEDRDEFSLPSMVREMK